MGVSRKWGVLAFACVALGAAIGASGTVAAGQNQLDAHCESVSDLVERPTGEILVLDDIAYCQGRKSTRIIQLDPSGELDTGFGDGGSAVPSVALDEPDFDFQSPKRLLLREGGGTLIVGWHQLAAFRPDGTPDPEFGTNGILDIRQITPAGPSGLVSGTVQPDGKILLLGYGASCPGLAVTRLLPSGEPDLEFGVGGTSVFALPLVDGNSVGWSGLGDLDLGADGEIFAGLSLGRREFAYPGVVKFDSQGQVDTSYGPDGSGFAMDVPDPGDVAGQVYVDSLRIDVAAGGSVSLMGTEASGLKLGRSGFVTGFDPFGSASGLPERTAGEPQIIDSENRIVGVGNTNDYLGEDKSFSASRYLPDRMPDRAFGLNADGFFRAYMGAQDSDAQRVLELRSRDGYLVAGTVASARCVDFCPRSIVVVRLNGSGGLDAKFGIFGGLATVPELKCPLGTGADRGPTWVSPGRCRMSGGSFGLSASIVHAKKRPALSINTGGLGYRDYNSRDTDEVTEDWRVVRLRLPEPVRLRSPKKKKLLALRVGEDTSAILKDLAVRKRHGRYELTFEVSGSVEEPSTATTIVLKRGAFKLRGKRNRLRKLRVRATVKQGGTQNPERISTRSTRLRVKKAK